ncbi:MAG: integrase arm-type DNA-binding domain-containing protein [Nitrosomonas ureae]
MAAKFIMPKKAKELTALAISRFKDQGRYSVGGVDGLHIRIHGMSRAWILRVAVGTKINSKGKPSVHRRDIGLGPYPEVSLAEAREKAREIRKQIRDGIDPILQKKQTNEALLAQKAKAKTFRECANVVIANKSRELKNAKHLAQWQSTLETYVYPAIGDRTVSTITKADVVSVLEPIWQIKNETASRLRGRIETILDYAKAMEYREGDNPAAWKGTLEPILGKIKREVRSQPSLPYTEISAFMAELRKREGISARALEFVILTAARAGEVFGAIWDEIDLKNGIWIIPASKMKAGREHWVPLSEQAVKLLQALPQIAGNNYVFPAANGGKLSDMALTMLIRKMHSREEKEGHKGFIDPRQNKIVVTHGFRSTFRDWAGETTHHPREVIEHALAHQLKDKAEAAYARGTLFEKRRMLMNDWDVYIKG